MKGNMSKIPFLFSFLAYMERCCCSEMKKQERPYRDWPNKLSVRRHTRTRPQNIIQGSCLFDTNEYKIKCGDIKKAELHWNQFQFQQISNFTVKSDCSGSYCPYCPIHCPDYLILSYQVNGHDHCPEYLQIMLVAKIR